MEEQEIICDDCEAEFTILYSKTLGVPSTCPWCGRSVHIETEEEDE